MKVKIRKMVFITIGIILAQYALFLWLQSSMMDLYELLSLPFKEEPINQSSH